MRRAAKALENDGAKIEAVKLDWGLEQDELWSAHWAVYLAAFFGHVLPGIRTKMDPIVVKIIERGLAMSAVEFKRLEFGRTAMWKQISPILQRCDALLCPTMAQPAVGHGRSDQDYWRLDDTKGDYLALDCTSVFTSSASVRPFRYPAASKRRAADRVAGGRPAVRRPWRVLHRRRARETRSPGRRNGRLI